MTVPIVSRAQWGATPWQGELLKVSIAEKANALVHYYGGAMADRSGVSVPRLVERIHLDNGWIGVGYNFMVDLEGIAYEGRGWNGVGSQCPGYNRTGVGIFVACGGTQTPSDAQLRTTRALYDELVARRGGAAVRKMCHHDGVSTSCPGDKLHAWRVSGMPYPAGTSGSGSGETGGGVVIPAPTPVASLDVDGRYGSLTVKARQKSLGTVVDGVVSGQSFSIRDANPGLDARANWEFVRDPRGSAMIRADQKRLAAKGLYKDEIDGLAGPNYWRAVQLDLSLDLPSGDREISDPSETVRRIQKALNSDRAGYR